MPDEQAPLTRRDFTRVALVAAATPVLGSAGCAGAPQAAAVPAPAAPPVAPPPVAPPPVAPAPAPASTAPATAVAVGDPVLDVFVAATRARFGDRLSADQLREVREQIEGNLRAARQLRDFALPLATEPAAVYRAYRAAEGGR